MNENAVLLKHDFRSRSSFKFQLFRHFEYLERSKIIAMIESCNYFRYHSLYQNTRKLYVTSTSKCNFYDKIAGLIDFCHRKSIPLCIGIEIDNYEHFICLQFTFLSVQNHPEISINKGTYEAFISKEDIQNSEIILPLFLEQSYLPICKNVRNWCEVTLCS